jgi:hypothetical protein
LRRRGIEEERIEEERNCGGEELRRRGIEEERN